jgi:hypothetical protein
MARKKQVKQKQKQKQNVRQQVSQQVVVKVGSTPRRRKSAPRKPKAEPAVQQSMPPQIIQQAPLPLSPFLEQSAIDTNRRLGMFGEQIGGLMAQQEARDAQQRRHLDALEHRTRLAEAMLSRPAELPSIPVHSEFPPMIKREPVEDEGSPFAEPPPSARPSMKLTVKTEPDVRERFPLRVQEKFAEKAEVENRLGFAPTGSPFATAPDFMEKLKGDVRSARTPIMGPSGSMFAGLQQTQEEPPVSAGGASTIIGGKPASGRASNILSSMSKDAIWNEMKSKYQNATQAELRSLKKRQEDLLGASNIGPSARFSRLVVEGRDGVLRIADRATITVGKDDLITLLK